MISADEFIDHANKLRRDQRTRYAEVMEVAVQGLAELTKMEHDYWMEFEAAGEAASLRECREYMDDFVEALRFRASSRLAEVLWVRDHGDESPF